MFSKRLSIALCATMCFGTLLFGNNPESSVNTKPVEEENSWMAPEAFSPVFTVHQPTCSSDENGYFTIEIENPSVPTNLNYEYRIVLDGNLFDSGTWNGLIRNTTSILGEGEYFITVKELSTTTSYPTQKRTITPPDPVELSVVDFSKPQCSGELGYIYLDAIGGSGNYTFYLNYKQADERQSTDGEFNNLPEGTYDLIVFDDNLCSDAANSIKIEIGKKINPTNVAVTPISCENGFAEIIISGLPSDQNKYEILLNGSTDVPKVVDGSQARLVNITEGTYNLVINSTTCTTTNDDWLYSDNPIDIKPFNDVVLTPNPASGHVLDCGGDETTSVTVDVADGKDGEPVTVILDNNNGVADDDPHYPTTYGGTAIFQNVGVGNYTLRWVDGTTSTCSGSIPYKIGGPDSPLTATFVSSTPVLCNGESTGAIQLKVTGGDENYEYSIDGGSFETLPSNQLIENLSASSGYNITIQDGSTCSDYVENIEITQPQFALVSSVVKTQKVTCPDGNDGWVELNTSGGTAPYVYNLYDNGTFVQSYNGNGQDTIKNLAPSENYSISVADINNCVLSNDLEFSIANVTPVEITYSIAPPVFCYGSYTTIDVNATGGTETIKTYILERRDGQSKQLSGNSGVTFDSITSGFYTLSVIDNENCQLTDTSFTIDPPRQIVISNYNDSLMVDCQGETADLYLDIDAADPIHYSVNGGAKQSYTSGVPISGLAGTPGGQPYDITIFDVNECSKSIDVTVYEPEGLAASVGTITDVSCKGGSTGQVPVTVTGGTSGYKVILTGTSGKVFTESSSQGNIVVKNLPADTYDLQVTDKNGCQLSAPITGVVVKEPENSFEIQDPVYSQEIKCFGDAAKLTLTATGGWSVEKDIHVTGSHGVDITQPSGSEFELLGGTYLVSATNEDGCVDDRTIIVEQPDSLKITATRTNFTCSDSEDAEIVITVAENAGVPDYSYGLGGLGSGAENPFTGNTVTINTNLEAKTYFIEVQDANLCRSNVVELTIQKPDPITFEVQRDSFVSCFGAADGKINILNASGSWDTGYLAWIAPSGGTFEQTNYPVIKNLAAGNYEVKLSNRDETCFSEPVEVTIKEPTPLSFLEDEFETTHLKCYNIPTGKLVVKATGGLPFDLEYRIANGGTYDSGYGENNSFENLPSGFYDVWVRIAGNDNCVLQYSVEFGEKIEIENPAELIIDSLVVNNFRCRDDVVRGSVQIVAQGGVGIKNYYLSDAPERITDNPNTTGIFTELGEFGQNTTTYHFYVTDKNGCQTEEQAFNIINPPKLEISGWEKFDALCHNDRNGSIDLTIVGGTIESNYTITDLLPDLTYNVEKITDNNYVINGLGSSDPAGTEYQPVVTDDNGCEVMIETPVLIGNPEQVEYEVTIDSALCHGDIDDKIIIHATGGTGTFYYSLDGGNTYGALEESSFVDEPEGMKKPYVKDENGCVSPNVWPEFLYEEPKPLEVRFTKQGIMCWEDEFGNVVLDITGGTGNYYMSINEKDFNAAGSYSNPYEIPRDRRDTTVYDFLDNDIQLPEAQTFAIYLKDKNGCHVQNIEGVNSTQKPVFSTTFPRPDPLVLLEDPMPYPVTCAGDRTGRIGFKVEGGTFPNFVFTATKQQDPHQGSGQEFNGAVNSSGRGEIEKLYSGIYRCVVTDQHNCQAFAPDLTEIPHVDVEIDAEFDSISVVIYDTIQPVCDSKSNGELHINVLNYMDMGVDVRLEKFNQGSKIFQIHKDDTITYTAEDGDIIFNPEVDFSTYEVHQQLLAERLGIGLYQVIAQDRRSTCTDTVVFNLSSEFGVDCPMVSYYNWFSPHSGNQENDEWEIIETEYEDYLLQIYTSYGELVYSDKGNSDVENIKWDGLDDNGMPAPVGTYIYILQKSNGVRDTIINGNVSIIRNVYK